MQINLPDKIDPWKLATASGRLEGEIPLERMPRLTSMLSNTGGQIKVVLKAGIDEQGIRFLKGRIDTAVVLRCQRCLEPVQLPLGFDFQLGIIVSESQAPNLPADYEPLLASEDGVVISELVEDELILALPLVARHEDMSQCQALGFVSPGKGMSTEQEERVNPFAALSTLLKDSKTKE